MDLSHATDAERALEPEVRQLVFGSTPPRRENGPRGYTLYRSAPAEDFPRLAAYVGDQLSTRFKLNGTVSPSAAWWVVERTLRSVQDHPAADCSIAERRLVAAKHLMALGDDYSDDFTVIAANGMGSYSLGALRRLLQNSPREQKGIAAGKKRFRGAFEQTKTLRMTLAACIVSGSVDQSTLDWREQASRDLALTVVMRITQFINEEVSEDDVAALTWDREVIDEADGGTAPNDGSPSAIEDVSVIAPAPFVKVPIGPLLLGELGRRLRTWPSESTYATNQLTGAALQDRLEEKRLRIEYRARNLTREQYEAAREVIKARRRKRDGWD